MVNPATLFNGTSGLNTILDPERLSQGGDDSPGIIELAQAVNISIDDRGLPSLRRGSSLVAPGEFHSLFCDGGDTFVVQDRTEDAAIMRVLAIDGGLAILEGVRSGLAKNQRMSFAQVNADTFYSNGTQNGFIRMGASSPWPVGSYSGPEADRDFTPAPVARHVAFKPGGVCLLAEGKTLWVNHSPFEYGLFNKRSGFVHFQSTILMVCPVRSGVFVSDEEVTWFLRGNSWHDFEQQRADNAPVLEWSLAHDNAPVHELGLEREEGFARVWASTEGLCIGLDSGRVINVTDEKIKYPQAYAFAACLLDGTTVINTVY